MPGDTALVWSNATALGDTEPTGVKLRLDWSSGAFKALYDIDTGSGFSGSFTEIGGGSVATGYVAINEVDGSTAECTTSLFSQSNFAILSGQNQALSGDASVRIKASGMTVTGSS